MTELGLKNLVLVSPRVMLLAEVSSFDTSAAEAGFMRAEREKDTADNLMDNILGQFRMNLSGLPNVRMMIFNVIRLAIEQFEVFYSIVGLVAVYMMDTFAPSQFSAKVLLHYIAMLKNAFPVNQDTKVAISRNARLTFSKLAYSWMKIVITVSKFPQSVTATYLTVLAFQDVGTAFYPTCFPGSHAGYHNTKGEDCQ